MARNEISFLVNLRKNTLTTSKSYGQYFGEAESKEPLSLKGFARHMTSHGKLADYSMVVLVLQQLVECMTEMMTQGQPVKLDGLGTFYPSIEGVGANSVEDAVNGLNDLIKGVHLRFLPEGVKGDELTSRKLKSDCHFEAYQLVKTHYKMIGGKKKTYQTRTPLSYKMIGGKKKSYQTRTPLSTYGIQQAEEDPEPEP